MSINGDIREQKSLRNFWTFLFPQTVTKLVVDDIVVASATTISGPAVVNVKVFLSEILGSLSPIILDNNPLLRSLVHQSLGSKPVIDKDINSISLLKVYLEKLHYNVITVDLLLCACLLQSDSLQLPDGRYLQATKISFKK